MQLTLWRTRFYDTHTTGQLYINEDYFGFTLEDKVREIGGVPVEKWKIKGETAIPSGSYEVVLETSPKFGPETITLKKVPGFTGIRIHAGNTAEDTEGCILVGYRINSNGVIVPGTTRPALRDLKQSLKDHEDITIQII